jgi:hypothetical protein
MTRLSNVVLAGFVALGLAAFAASASAQTVAPAPAPLKPVSPAALASAKEILAAKNVQLIYQEAVPGLVQRAKAVFLQSNLNLQKDLDEVAIKVAKDLAGREQEVGEQMAKIYGNLFTEAELKDLAAFYKSPLGKKVIDNEPQAFAQTRVFMNQWAEKFVEEINTKIKAEMKSRGKPV